MESYKNIFIFLANKNQDFSINPDIFETNVINLILLLILVFYVGKDFLGSILINRQRLILDKVEEADKKVNEADKRFLEARLQWSQANILSNNLEKRTLKKIQDFHELQNLKNKDSFSREYYLTLITLDLRNQQLQKQIRDYVIELALIESHGTFSKLITHKKFQFTYSNYSILLIKKLFSFGPVNWR